MSVIPPVLQELFGQVEGRSRACRDASGRANQLLSDLYLMNNLNYAVRSVRKTPGLADVLGCGIDFAFTFFSFWLEWDDAAELSAAPRRDEWIEKYEGRVEGMCKDLCSALWVRSDFCPDNTPPCGRMTAVAPAR